MVEERGQKRPASDEPGKPSQTGFAMEETETRKREDDDTQAEERQSQMARSEPTSPSHLYPPAFAGQVGRVEREGDMCVATVYELGDEYLFGARDEMKSTAESSVKTRMNWYISWDNGDMEHEPVVSPQELASLDEKAFQEEVSSRLEMGVLKEAKENELSEAFVELTTTSVHNWRYRGNAWKRIEGPD